MNRVPVNTRRPRTSRPGSNGTTPSGQAGPTARGSWSQTTVPSGPSTVSSTPFPQPQPSQCHTGILPTLVMRASATTGEDGSPPVGETTNDTSRSGTLGLVALSAQPA